jgi:DNA repair protein RecO (recombination protein O)
MKYSETSIITDIYTEQKGMRSYLISGVRSKRAKIKASLLQVMSLVEMVAYDKSEKGLNRVKELKSAYVYQSLPFEVPKSAVGLFMAEMARKAIREPEEHGDLFHFLFHAFRFLDQTHQPVANIHLWFVLKLSAFLGFIPGGDWSQETPFFDLQEGIFVADAPPHVHFLEPAQSLLLHQLLDLELETCHTLSMNKQARKSLLLHLIDYYRLHIENFPDIHAHIVLQEVLS